MGRRVSKPPQPEPLLIEARRLGIAVRAAGRAGGLAALEAMAEDMRALLSALRLRSDAIARERQFARLRRQAFAAYGHRPQPKRG